MSSPRPASTRVLTALIAACLGLPASSRPRPNLQAHSMRVESCSLGCTSGGPGLEVSCPITSIPMNREVRIRFSRPVDPASLSVVTVMIIDHATGQNALGTRFVDPGDPNTVVFRPSFALDPSGNPVFGFLANTTYQVLVPGVSQGDSPPYVRSADSDALPNRTRMRCNVAILDEFDSPATTTCAGDGVDPSVTPCPCANFGAPGRGCANSTAAGVGGWLYALGSTAPDGVSLVSTAAPSTALTIFFQGDQSLAGGIVFGDGIRCVSGRIVRLGSMTAVSGIAVYPGVGNPSITARSAARGNPIAHGSVRGYQAWYRDDDPAFCGSPVGGTWNVSNALSITW